MDDDDEAWDAPDGTRWLDSTPTWIDDGWTGWQPGEDGVWFLTDAEFYRDYPTAPPRAAG